MTKLLLMTQGFPYGESERGFLPSELDALRRRFQVSLMAFDNGKPALHPPPENVAYSRYTWPERVSLPGLLAQLKFPEVRADLWRAFRSGNPNRRRLVGSILAYSLRAEQIRPLLRSLVERGQIDVVYTYWCVQATVAALRLKKEYPSLRVVTRFHGADLYLEQSRFGWQPLRRFLASGCDRLIFVCRTGKDYFMRQWDGDWRNKALVAYIGSRPLPRCDTGRQPGEALGLISCSSLIPLKRVSLIIDALALLPPEYPVDWHLLGDGEQRAGLEQQTREALACHPHIRITFHGHVPNLSLAQAYREARAQLLITTSETEGLPVSIMEAYSMGIPVIATAVGGIPEMLEDGQSGFLLPANPTPAEVAATLERYIALSQAGKAALSQNAFDCWQSRFNAESNAEALMRALSDELKGEGKP